MVVIFVAEIVVVAAAIAVDANDATLNGGIIKNHEKAALNSSRTLFVSLALCLPPSSVSFQCKRFSVAINCLCRVISKI